MPMEDGTITIIHFPSYCLPARCGACGIGSQEDVQATFCAQSTHPHNASCHLHLAECSSSANNVPEATPPSPTSPSSPVLSLKSFSKARIPFSQNAVYNAAGIVKISNPRWDMMYCIAGVNTKTSQGHKYGSSQCSLVL